MGSSHFVFREVVAGPTSEFPMEEYGGTRCEGISTVVKKKRTRASRRPRLDSPPRPEDYDTSPSLVGPPSDDLSKVSSDENIGCGAEGESFHKNSYKNGNISFYHGEPGGTFSNNEQCNYSPASGRSGLFVDQFGNDNKLKKVKLKVGGVTRTIQANSTSNGTSEAGSSKNRSSDSTREPQKHNFRGALDENHSPSDKRRSLQGIPWKDFSRGGFCLGKEDTSMVKVSARNTYGKREDKAESVQKRKRVCKRRMLDGEFSDDDDEIRYLEKLKTSRTRSEYKEDDEGSSKKQRRLSSISNIENTSTSRSGNDEKKKKSRSDRSLEDTDYEEEVELTSDGDPEGKSKNQKKESIDSLMGGTRELNLTKRQRALQSSKDAPSAPGASLIEFPNGLPPAPPRKQKEKLSEVEQQAKKAEAAQRRRMQVEKAAKESEAEAIRKILGQDSSRKKREDKIKKRQEELAQEKAAKAQKLAPNIIRWVFGPSGTIVTFPNGMGLPTILDSKPCSYPPPREKCAGPSCTKPYKYRDSESMLPLCSLQCYKAIRGMSAEACC